MLGIGCSFRSTMTNRRKLFYILIILPFMLTIFFLMNSQTKAVNRLYYIPSIHKFDLNQSSANDHKCVRLAWKPAPYICIHNPENDILVSRNIDLNGVWEKKVLQVFQDLLKTDPEMGEYVSCHLCVFLYHTHFVCGFQR